MKLLTLDAFGGHEAHTLIDADTYSIGDRRRLFTLGLIAIPTVENMREAAQARGISGWHNMKHSTLLERLNGESNTE